MPQNYKLAGTHCIKVRPADNPQNIIWEHLEYSKNSKLSRKMFFQFLIVIAMIITTVFVIVGAIFSFAAETKALEDAAATATYSAANNNWVCDSTIFA
jgi:hypothetical protein